MTITNENPFNFISASFYCHNFKINIFPLKLCFYFRAILFRQTAQGLSWLLGNGQLTEFASVTTPWDSNDANDARPDAKIMHMFILCFITRTLSLSLCLTFTTFLSLSLSLTHTHTHTHTPQLFKQAYSHPDAQCRLRTSSMIGTCPSFSLHTCPWQVTEEVNATRAKWGGSPIRGRKLAESLWATSNHTSTCTCLRAGWHLVWTRKRRATSKGKTSCTGIIGILLCSAQ